MNEIYLVHSQTFVIFSTRGTAFVSGHADGSIVRYIITEGSTTEQQVSVNYNNINLLHFRFRLKVRERETIRNHN